MAKEIKAVAAEPNAENVSVVEEEIEKSTSLKLRREQFVSNSNGQTYWGYFVDGEIAGKLKRAEFIPLDYGGYEVLDIVFLFSEEANIKVKRTVSKNSMGRRVTFTSYEAENIDPKTGKRLHCDIKPARKSDEALFDMFVTYLDL